jgi:hypothetical protein
MKRRAQRQTLERPEPSQKKGKPSLSSKKGKPSPSKKKSPTGGILANKRKKYTSFVVNIRPSKWDDKFKPSKFWIGKHRSFERAQVVADAVYFYVGEPPFHFKDVVNLYPSITCIGIVPGTPEVLSTQEMFRTYTSAIAKGVEFKPQREDFIAQVEGVIKMDEFPFPAPPEHAVEHDEGEDTPDVPLLRADYGVVSPRRDEVEDVVVSPKGDDDEEEDTPAMEEDETAAMARRMSSNEVPGSAPPQAFVPSFDFQHNELASHLRSVGWYSDFFVKCSTSQFIGSMSLTESIDDCPTFQNEEGDQEWKQWIMDDLIDRIEP